jgi:hypothetical protein
VSIPVATLGWREALATPCFNCPTSPCCTYVMLTKLPLQHLLDLDYALYLSNFEGIYLGIGPDRGARVYFYQHCSYLDADSSLCTVHGTSEQPSICVHYNAHSCQYRHAMTADVHPEQPLMDRRRLRWYAEHCAFDDDRKLVAAPDWDELLEAFRSMPLERQPAAPPEPDPVLSMPAHRQPRRLTLADAQVIDPCHGCGAWCCKTLVFSRDRPQTASQLDFFRYCVGFPSVEVGVSDEDWGIVVRTTCRHLEANRCSIFGQDERPLRCSYYDALKCTYRVHFGTPRPDQLVRVTRAQFPVLAAAIGFDELGRIVSLPSVEVLRARIDEAVMSRGNSKEEAAWGQ